MINKVTAYEYQGKLYKTVEDYKQGRAEYKLKGLFMNRDVSTIIYLIITRHDIRFELMNILKDFDED